MASINFVNPNAAMGDALRAYLVQQETERRLLQKEAYEKQDRDTAAADRKLAIEDRTRNIGRQEAGDARQRVVDERLTAVQTQQDADRAARIYGPDADLTGHDDVAALLEKGNYAVDKAATDISTVNGAPVAAQPSTDMTKVPGFVTPKHRAETGVETVARQQREEASRKADEDREARLAQTRDTIAGREETARIAAQNSAENARLARAIAQQNADSTALRANDAHSKTVNEQHDREVSVAASRDRVRSLADRLLKHDSLNAIAGAWDSRTPDILPGSVQAANYLEQLVDVIALDARGALKGQGAISDFESKMLKNALGGALKRGAGATALRDALQDVLRAYDGDKPRAGMGQQQPGQNAPARGAGAGPGGGQNPNDLGSNW